jgi:hypothetical protein
LRIKTVKLVTRLATTAVLSVPRSSQNSQGRGWILNIHPKLFDRRNTLILDASVGHLCMAFLFSSPNLNHTRYCRIQTVPHPYTVLIIFPRSKSNIHPKSTVPLPAGLKAMTVGQGESPFSVNVRKREGRRKVFGKRERLPLLGGNGYQCPGGSDLIALLTRRT